MDAQPGWPYLAGLLLLTVAAADTVRSFALRQRLFLALRPVERAFLVGATGFLLLTWWNVVLAEVGGFGPRTQVLLPALVLFFLLPGRLFGDRASGWFGGRRRRWRPDPRALALLVIVPVAATLYMPPFDVRFEARDPGVYYLAGVQLARHGGLQWRDPLLEAMPPAEREAWYPSPADGAADRHRRYVGFYLDTPPGTGVAMVKPQAMPVFPTWIATGQLAFGHSGALASGAVLALLGAVAWMFFVGRWTMPLLGALVGVAVAANFVQAWFARYSAAEMPAQALVGIGLYGLVAYRRHGDALFGLVAAGGFGLAWLAKAELLLLVGPLGLLLIHDVARDGIVARDWVRFWIPLAALLGHTLAHGRWLLWPYFYNLLQQVHLPPEWFLPAAATGAAAFLGLLALILGARAVAHGRAPALVHGADRWLAITVGITVVPFVLWGLWVRVQTPSWEAANFRHLLWAVSPAGLLLAVAGVAAVTLLPRGSRWRDAALALLLAMIFAGLMRRQIIPMLPWAYRRWVPVVLPGTFAVAALALSAWWSVLRGVARRHARVVFVATLLVGVALAAPYQRERIGLYQDHAELPGSSRAMEAWRELLGPDALVIFEPRTLRGIERFEAALAVEGDYDVLRLPAPDLRPSLIVNAVRRAARAGKPTFLVTTGYLDGLEQPAASYIGSLRFESRRLYEPYVRAIDYSDFAVELPVQVEPLVIEAAVYRLQPEGGLRPLAGELDVGSVDELYLAGGGFHEAELAPDGRDFRWTTGRAEVLLPGLTDATETLILRAAPAPEEIHPQGQQLVVSLDGTMLGEVTMTPGWVDYRFALPEDWAPAPASVPRLLLETSSFRPYEKIPGSLDRRSLGLALDKVGWQPVRPGEGQ